MNGRQRGIIVGIVVLVLVAVAALVVLGPLTRSAISFGGRSAGYDVTYGSLTNHGGHLTMTEPRVRRPGEEQLFAAHRVDVAYDLGHVFGGPYLYGIAAIDLDRPAITIVHHRDGTYNFAVPSAQSGNGGSPTIPRIRLRIHDGSVAIADATRIFAHSRALGIDHLDVTADIDPHAISHVALGLDVRADGGRYPVSGHGTLDEGQGYEFSQITAASLALAPLVDYALNSPSLHVAAGGLQHVDARFYGLRNRRGGIDRHLAVTANLANFVPYLNGIAKPLRDGHGPLRVYDNGLAIPRVDGSIAGIPVRIAGGIYGLAKPTLRLGITGRGDLRRLLTLNDAAAKLPVSGPVAFTLFVEGDATAPMTLASFASPGIAYGRIPIDAPAGLVALHGADTSILRTTLGYAGATLGARGNLHVENKHTNVDILANVSAPLAAFPYAGTLIGPLTLAGNAILAGADSNVVVTGAVDGSNATTRLASTFSVAADGTGTVGPLSLVGPGGRALYARIALDRPHGRGGVAFVSAHDFAFDTAGRQPVLPGIALAAVPPVSGTVDADLAGTFGGSSLALGGSAHGYGLRVLGYPIDDVTARASVDGSRVVANVRYRGALAPLARAAGGKIAAGGTVDIPVGIVASGPRDVLAQIDGARFTGARVAGVGVDALSGTVRLHGSTIDVLGARATLDGHDIVAAGSFGSGGTLDVSAAGIELATLRAAGLPVRSGAVSAVASISGTAASPHVESGIAASDVELLAPAAAGLPIDANTGVTYDAGRLSIHDALVRAGPAVGSLDGDVRGLRGNPRAATYALQAHVREADIATLAHIARADRLYPEGTLDANVAVTGTGSDPRVRGDIAVPEGSINGLRFRDAAVALAGGLASFAAHDGRVSVGSSTLGFDGTASRSVQTIAFRAPRIDLSDFNDYFDAGDTLGGRGSITLAAANAPDRITTSGRIRLAHTHFRRFDVGDSRADWSTTGRTVHTTAEIGGSAGTIVERGDIALPATQPLRDLAHRSSVSLATRATNIDLRTWLPVVDVQAPVSGLANANATVRGRYPSFGILAHADVQHGMVAGIPLETASIDARAGNGRATITNAVLAIANLRATASGYAGLTPKAPFDLIASAQTNDIGALAKTLTTKTYDVAGAVQTTARVRGTIDRPLLIQTIDAQTVRYGKYTVPRAHAEIAVTRTRAQLTTAEIDLQRGRVLANASAPLELAPSPHIGPATSPVTFVVNADTIDLAQFAPLLPKGTVLGGTLGGGVRLVGSIAQPGLDGTLALTGGSFVGPQERSKISDLVAQVTFANRTATLHDTSAKVGGGTVSADGRLSVPDLRDPADSASAALALHSKYAVFNVPSLFRGRVNGDLTLTRVPHQRALLAGNLAVTSARVATTALVPKTAGPASSATPLPVALQLGVDVGDDVRVQGGPVDIGAKGNLTVGGTVATPTVAGELDSTGGTLSFYRTFNIQYPTTVTFDGTGVIPNVDALATTTVDNPQTDVTLHVTGPATQLNIAFDSNPSYSREQIVGILVGAQALGAVSGIATTPGSQPAQNPFQAAAEGQLGSLLTQNILEPFSSQLGGAVGLSNLAINYTPGGAASVGAQKKIFKNVSAVFAESFNYPQRQSLGLLVSPNKATAAQLTFFSQPQSNRFNTFEGALSLNSSNNSVTDTEPASGSSGFSFSLQRKF